MGNRFEITVVESDQRLAEAHCNAAITEIQRIEQLLSTFIADSQTNLINQAAGICPIPVDIEVFQLIERCIRISDLTDGYFDITYGGVDKSLWNFDKGMTALPSSKVVKEHLHLINYRHIILDSEEYTVFLKEKGMRIGFGGIGKGYAAEMAKLVLQRRGVSAGIVNASGDLTAWGLQANEKPWTVGIANPNDSHFPFSYLNISEKAVATSGNYEKYVEISDQRYAHTINPKTGMPAYGIKSVTIICPNAEIADALATPVSIMGINNALNLINQIEQVECIIIDEHNKIYKSNGINFL